MKTKNVSQRVKVGATPPSPVISVLAGISPDETPGGDHVAVMDMEQVELVATKGTKLNPRKWVKKCESQISELSKLKLKIVVLHDGIDKEVRMIQLVRFVAADLISIG